MVHRLWDLVYIHKTVCVQYLDELIPYIIPSGIAASCERSVSDRSPVISFGCVEVYSSIRMISERMQQRRLHLYCVEKMNWMMCWRRRWPRRKSRSWARRFRSQCAASTLSYRPFRWWFRDSFSLFLFFNSVFLINSLNVLLYSTAENCDHCILLYFLLLYFQLSFWSDQRMNVYLCVFGCIWELVRGKQICIWGLLNEWDCQRVFYMRWVKSR